MNPRPRERVRPVHPNGHPGRAMDELHENEQYFFTRATTHAVADIAARFAAPCCLCAPTVGRELARRGVNVTVLDIDTRFADVTGFVHFDALAPHWLAQRFDLIVCDPPYFTVPLSTLARTVRRLAHFDPTQKLLVSTLDRRARAFARAFRGFGLAPTGERPEYETVTPGAKNAISWWGNL